VALAVLAAVLVQRSKTPEIVVNGIYATAL